MQKHTLGVSKISKYQDACKAEKSSVRNPRNYVVILIISEFEVRLISLLVHHYTNAAFIIALSQP
jgi:hypothetical protein